MESVLEMNDLRAAFAVTRGYVLPHLPIHRCLDGILDRECATFDKEVTLQWLQPYYTCERLDERGELSRIDVRVGDFDLRCPQQVGLHLRPVKMRMVKPNWL